MNDNERELLKNINIDKAKKRIFWCILFSIINLQTYIIPFLSGYYDFGFFFEGANLICILIAIYFMTQYDEINSKRFIIFALFAIGWIFIYDFMIMLSYSSDFYSFVYYGSDFLLQEKFSILNIIFMFISYSYLKKADNPEKYKESTDWFYGRIDENKNKK